MMIRKALLEDLNDIYSLQKECFLEPWKEEDIAYELSKNPVNVFLVAVKDNKIVGYLDYIVTFNSSSIVQIAVNKIYRHQEIASSLLEKMISLLPSNGVEKVEFITLEVRKSNVAAVNLYHKFSFEDICLKPHYYKNGEDAIYMVKRM